jgi:hypothetical protein
MYASLLRDEALVPVVADKLRDFHGYLDGIRDRLARGRRRRAALGHALAFTTWRSLVGEQGLHRRDAVELMARLVESA